MTLVWRSFLPKGDEGHGGTECPPRDVLQSCKCERRAGRQCGMGRRKRKGSGHGKTGAVGWINDWQLVKHLCCTETPMSVGPWYPLQSARSTYKPLSCRGRRDRPQITDRDQRCTYVYSVYVCWVAFVTALMFTIVFTTSHKPRWSHAYVCFYFRQTYRMGPIENCVTLRGTKIRPCYLQTVSRAM